MSPQGATYQRLELPASVSSPSQTTAAPLVARLVKPEALQSSAMDIIARINTSAFERELNAVPEEIDGGNCFSPEQCLALARKIFASPPHARDIGRLKELLNSLVVPLVAKQRLSESPCAVLAEAVRVTVALVVSFHYDRKVSDSFQEFQAAVAHAARSNAQLKPLIVV